MLFKFLFFCFAGFIVYRMFVKPFLVNNLEQKNASRNTSGNNMMDMLRQFQQFQQQQQNGHSPRKNKSRDEEEYTDYEEIK